MNEIPAHLTLVSDLLKAISTYSKKAKRTVTGNAVVERESDDGKTPPMVVMYATYSSGNYMCWFADEGKMHLYSMVDGKLTRNASVLVSDMPKLQDAIDKVRKKIEKRKKSS